MLEWVLKPMHVTANSCKQWSHWMVWLWTWTMILTVNKKQKYFLINLTTELLNQKLYFNGFANCYCLERELMWNMISTRLREHATDVTFTLTLQTYIRQQKDWWVGSRSDSQTASDSLLGRGPPYHCGQKGIACFSRAVRAGAGPVSPEFVMQPLTPDGSLSEGLCVPRVGAPGCFGPHLGVLPRLNGRGAKEAFGRQDWQRSANAGHVGRGQGEPSTYCQILN